jgi:anti-anti-sigma regulatory factor
MFLATINKGKQLLCLTFIGGVSVEELERAHIDIAGLLDELTSGFRLLADFSSLGSMDINGAREIGKTMELCEQKGVALVVRIIPDPGKDIGLNILSVFHYRHRPRIVTCKSLVEAGEVLGFGEPGGPNKTA